MTWGVLRPVILLPAGVESWPRERLRTVLLHELAHVKRWRLPDPGARPSSPAPFTGSTRCLDRRVAAPNRARTRLRRPGAAIRRTAASDYAAALLEVARLPPARTDAAAAVPMARPSQLEGRLRAILDPSREPSRRDTPRGIPVACGGAVVLLPLSIARLEASDPKGPAAAE